MRNGPVRVAYLIDKLKRAGAQVHLGQLASRLDRRRFEPRVFCLLEGGPVADSLRRDGVPVEVLDLGRLYAPRGLAGLFRLARRLRADRVDLLHTYLVSANVYGSLAARLAPVPRLVTTRRDTGFSRNWRLRILEQWLVNPRAHRVVAVSPAAAEAARRERGLGGGRVVTIANGVDVSLWDPARHDREAARRLCGLSGDEPAVGVVASLSPVKGHADFLAAAALVAGRHSGARFFLVGDGPLRPALEARARDLGLSGRVVFTGVRDDVPALLAAFDVVALPSRTEGMSNALLEALAMARPVVATSVGGNPDVVRDGEDGRLVAPGDPEGLAAAILQLLEDRTQAESLGGAARRSVVERFSIETMVGRYESLYASLMEGSSA